MLVIRETKENRTKTNKNFSSNGLPASMRLLSPGLRLLLSYIPFPLLARIETKTPKNDANVTSQ